jgi:membrane protease YdiL (CAAX protease family)
MAGPRWRWSARGAWWRILVPLAAVVAGLGAAIGCVLAARALGASQDASSAVGVAVGSAGILLVGLVVLRTVQPAQRRLMLASKGRVGPSVAIGLGIGAAIMVGSAIIIGTGAGIDGDARDQLEEAQIALAGVWWQTALIVFALIVLAPLGEEILFRALELRGLVRLIPFAVAAPISGLLFTAAHYDAWVAWPRTLALVATGWALAWLYRWRGIPATITAHATVNTVAAIALIIQQ